MAVTKLRREQIGNIESYGTVFYVDTVNGNDGTGVLGDPRHPYKTDVACYGLIPDGTSIVYTLEFICGNTTRNISQITKNVVIKCYSGGSFRLLNVNNHTELIISQILVIDTPNCDWIFQSPVATGFRPSNIFRMACAIIQIDNSQSRFLGFFGDNTGAKDNFIDCLKLVVNAKIRLIDYRGYLKVGVLEFTANSNGFLFINHSYNGQCNLSIDHILCNTAINSSIHPAGFHHVNKFSGTGTFEDYLSQGINVSQVDFLGLSNYRYKVNRPITGAVPNTDYQLNDWTQHFVNFVGKIYRSGGNNSGLIVRNSTIYLSRYLQSLFGHLDLSGATFIFQNVTIIQDTPDVLFRFQNEHPLNITQYGFIEGTFTGFGTNVIVTKIF